MFKNWKTTLAGLAGGILTLLSQGVNLKSAAVATAIAAVGALAKDSDVTGGTREQ